LHPRGVRRPAALDGSAAARRSPDPARSGPAAPGHHGPRHPLGTGDPPVRLVAGLCGAVFAYLLVGLLTGHAPRPLRRPLRASLRHRPVVLGVSLRTWLDQAGVSVSPG